MSTPVTAVPGIGPATARQLADHGITRVEDLRARTEAELAALPGFGPLRARRVLEAAANAAGTEPLPAAPSHSESPSPGKKKDKAKSGTKKKAEKNGKADRKDGKKKAGKKKDGKKKDKKKKKKKGS